MQNNIIDILKDNLLRQLKPILVDEVTDELLIGIRKDVEEMVKDKVEELTLQGIESYRDVQDLEDQLRISFEWRVANGTD